MPLSEFEAENLTKSWNNEAPAKAASLWVQLHTGSPGKTCTANVATESKRVQITLKKLAAGEWTNENVLEYLGVAATEEIAWVSVWDAKEAGNARIYGELAAKEKLTKEKDARFKAEKLKLILA